MYWIGIDKPVIKNSETIREEPSFIAIYCITLKPQKLRTDT